MRGIAGVWARVTVQAHPEEGRARNSRAGATLATSSHLAR